ncbi:MAG: L-fucose:H+ symporter permease [Ferruginibacter sp.]|nr:L-fucose:H+ symporter permease [Ferruginibacter sp.]
MNDTKNKFLLPLILITSLFFLWGLAYGLLDVLNKHFQESLNITKTRSTLLQAAYFGAYFLVALPAALFMNRYGYKKGIIAGLLLYAAGAFLFYPAAQQSSFNFFLLALFIIASGLACLETAANPYVTVLGKPETSEFRLNLSQCFNGVGSFIGPIIAANLFFGDTNEKSDLGSVQFVYIAIGMVVLLIAGLFVRTALPEIAESELVSESVQDTKPLSAHPHFINAVVAQFFYVAAQVGVAALFINYCTEAGAGVNTSEAAYLLSIAMLLFTIGRFAGTALMRTIAPNKLLSLYALVNILLCVLVITLSGWISVYALMAIFFFESVMFPTIFALGVKDLGHHTKKGSSFIIMSIVGGALVPYAMGMLSERSTATAYAIPLVCFVVVAWYGWKGYKIK